ncbi:uncharacterized protein LOC141689436 isoform X1 [Apium graveolens]|uniref:uncharacterized protein LOC141689436 isoform X1 n=1 Tax=Apium graveolens TaxID=4045 RepID=UPI003D7A3073
MIHESPEFKEISEKSKESKKHDKDPHFLGKGGYIGNMSKWRQNDPIASLDTSESSIYPSILSTEHSYDWIRVRTEKRQMEVFTSLTSILEKCLKKLESCKGKYLMVHGPHVVTMTCSLVYLGIRNIGDVLEGLEKEQKSRVYSDHKKVNKAGISLWMN